MYEHRTKPPVDRPAFRRRVYRHLAWIAVIIGCADFIGVLGYHFLAGLPWIDALLDASMILGGMGPVSTLHSTGAKAFASIYALFSGLVFIGVSGLAIAPFAHRLLHRFHWEEPGEPG
jgi:hypothetical protein